jgi:hypothetical protein
LRLGHPEDGDVITKPAVKVGFGFYGTTICRDGRRRDRDDIPIRTVAEFVLPNFVGERLRFEGFPEVISEV